MYVMVLCVELELVSVSKQLKICIVIIYVVIDEQGFVDNMGVVEYGIRVYIFILFW